MKSVKLGDKVKFIATNRDDLYLFYKPNKIYTITKISNGYVFINMDNDYYSLNDKSEGLRWPIAYVIDLSLNHWQILDGKGKPSWL